MVVTKWSFVDVDDYVVVFGRLCIHRWILLGMYYEIGMTRIVTLIYSRRRHPHHMIRCHYSIHHLKYRRHHHLRHHHYFQKKTSYPYIPLIHNSSLMSHPLPWTDCQDFRFLSSPTLVRVYVSFNRRNRNTYETSTILLPPIKRQPTSATLYTNCNKP